MKNIFLATTALVATAGFAAADINLSGGANLGLKYNNAAGNVEDLVIHREITLTVAMTGETDGGLTFGADMTITAAGVGDVVAYIEGGFGKLSVGDVGSAVDANLGLSDLGFDGIGTDNLAEAQIDAADAGSIMYKGTFGDFTIAASYDMSQSNAVANGDTFSVAALYNMGDYNFGLGYDDTNDAFSIKAGATISNISVNALMTTSNVGESYGLTAAYTMGATTITAAYSKDDVANVEGYGIGFGYDLGGGATLAGAVGEVGGNTVADLGITMSF